jgi:hypothetical protein
LQISRAFGPLCQLVRAGFEENPFLARSCALTIADAILFGARDRSRDKLLRTLYDQQRSVDSLQAARPARSRPPSSPTRASAKAAA